ncbi:MAG TPA: low temperature requirement protein A [Frankiaceae bacterium]|nr:low temperature requirement protein A [Frankiaceae bacterium]
MVKLSSPPGLQTDLARSASRLELFFDLAFVLVVAELAGVLSKDLSGRGVLVFVGLYVVTWWSWASPTLYANRFDTDDVVFRVMKLASMLGVIGLAASASDATGKRVVPFTLCFVILRLLVFAQYARAWRSVPDARPKIQLYLLGSGAAATLWSVSLAVPHPWRYVLWAIGLAVDVLVPIGATFAPGWVPVHLEHLPERLGLFVILVLGESVAAVASGVHDVQWTLQAVGVGTVCFVLAAGLWWVAFDLGGGTAKQLLLEASDNGRRLGEDIFFYGHLPITLGLAAVGVGIEHMILESSQNEPSQWTRLVLCGGVAVFLASVSLTNNALTGRWASGWLWPAAAALLAVADAAVSLPALFVVGALALLVLVVVVVGTVQESKGRIVADQL